MGTGPAESPPTKVDFRRLLDSYRARRGEFRLLTVPPRTYLMIDGLGDPNTSAEFAAAVGALYPVAYALKFASRKQVARDYAMPPLEGLWWAEDMDAFTSSRDKTRWRWTLMILTPEWATENLVSGAVDALGKRKEPPARLADVRWEALDEGLCVQTLHVGSFDDEADVLRHMHDVVIAGQRLELTGTHHEIYLSDARRVAPDRRRTILRQPVRPAED